MVIFYDPRADESTNENDSRRDHLRLDRMALFSKSCERKREVP